MGIKSGHQHDLKNENTRLLSTQDLNSQLPSHCVVQSNPSFNPRHHQLHRCITTLRGHRAFISSLAVAGNLLYSGSFDNEIRSWTRHPNDSPTPDTHNNVVAVGKGAVKSMIVMSNKLFTAHQDHKIRVWKIGNHREDEKYARIATLPTLGDRALKLLAPGNHVQVRRHKTSTWVHHVDTVSALALSEDESLLYSASWDRTIKVWLVSGFRCLESVRNAHDDAINALALSTDGCVFTGSADKTIKVWKKAEGDKKHSLEATLEEHNSGINALVLNAEGAILYSGACDGSIMVWERDGYGNMVALNRLWGHNNSVLCLTMVADVLCSGSADRSIRVWRKGSAPHSCLAVLEGHKGPVKCLTAATDHYSTSDDDTTTTTTTSCSSSSSSSTPCLIYSGSLDCEIKVWRIVV